MAEIKDWDIVAANNDDAPPNGFPENMNYSEVNNAARELMAVLARYDRDTRGSLVAGGTANAITVTPTGTYTAYFSGLEIGFTAAAANTGAVTLNVGGVGAVNLVDAAGAALEADAIQIGGVYQAVHDGTQFRLRGGGGGDTGDVTFGSGFVDLVDSIANLVSGPGDNQHIEMDTSSIQGKLNETTTSGLFINPLGGITSIGSGNFTALGAVSLYDNGNIALRTNPTGVQVIDPTGDLPRIELLQDDIATVNGYLQGNATAGYVVLASAIAADTIRLSATATGGALRQILEGDPDGDTVLYAGGTARFSVVSNGASITSGQDISPSVSADGILRLGGNAYSGYITLDATAMYIGHNTSSRGFAVRTNNVDRIVVSGAGVTTILHSGAETFRSNNVGAILTGNAFNTNLDLHNDADVRQAFLSVNKSSGLVTLSATDNGAVIQISATTTGGATQNQVHADPDDGVTVHAQGTSALVTQVSTDDYTTSGARVLDHTGTHRDVGFNVMPQSVIDVTTTLDESHAGASIKREGTANATYILPNGSSSPGQVPPVGSMVVLKNFGTAGTMFISATGTLNWLNGSGAPATGTRTLAEGGVCTVNHVSDSEWDIWGIGLT